MANGPGDYRDPKVTTTTGRSGSMSWLWWLLGALLVLLILGWLLGWFGSEVDEAVVTTDEAATTESVVVEDETAAEEGTVIEGAPVEEGAVVEEAPAE